MTRSMQRVIIGVSLASLLSGCQGQTETDGMTPAPSSGPAFFVKSFREAGCREDVCVVARLQNMGDRSGSGSCQLLATQGTANGNVSVEGPVMELPVVDPGQTVTRRVRWRAPVPRGNLRLLCEPGPLM